MSFMQYGNMVERTNVTATSGGTLTLTNVSPVVQILTGSSSHTVVLPDATTFATSGNSYKIINQSTGLLTLNFNGGAAFTDASGTNLSTIAPHTSLTVTLQTNGASAGTWAAVTAAAGSGTGGINYITYGTAEAGTSGWATYADAAGNKPVDGTGGSATGLTFSASSSSPLRGTNSFLMAQTNSTSLQGKGVSYDFTIDSADQAKMLSVSMDYNASSTFVASNGTTAPLNDGTTTTNAGNSDVEVFLYDKTNAVLIPVSPQVITANGSNNFTFSGEFQTASNSTSYRLIFHVATTSANATGWNFKFDNVIVGPQITATGAAISDSGSTSYPITLSSSFGSSTSKIVTRRVGDRLIGDQYFISGSTLSTTASIILPAGLSIDTAKIGTANNGIIVGDYIELAVGAGPFNVYTGSISGRLFIDPSTPTLIYFGTQDSSSQLSRLNASSVSNNTEPVNVRFDVPIAGWSSTTTMSNDADTRVIASKYTGSTTSFTTNATTDIVAPTLAIDTSGSYNSATGVYTVPVSGIYRVSTNIFPNGTVSGTVNGRTSLQLAKNGSAVGFFGTFLFQTTTALTPTLTGSIEVQAVAGDLLKVQAVSISTAPTWSASGDANSWVSFDRLSGPATIAASESVNARYYNLTGGSINNTDATVAFITKDFDTHNAYSSGTYTVPISGKYQINAKILESGTISTQSVFRLAIYKNGSIVSQNVDDEPATLSSANFDILCTDMISCLAGDLITIRASSTATTPTIVVDTARNYFSIARVGN